MPSIEDPGTFIAEVLSRLRQPPNRVVLLLPISTSGAGPGSGPQLST
jgi:hypothetical protein